MRQGRTSTYYCSKHERLLGWKYKEWIDFSLETITRIKALYEFFQSAHMETHFTKLSRPHVTSAKSLTARYSVQNLRSSILASMRSSVQISNDRSQWDRQQTFFLPSCASSSVSSYPAPIDFDLNHIVG